MSTTTPNLGLTVPTPGTTPGPDYADQVSENFNIIDEEVFSPNNPVTPSGIVIDDDLDFRTDNGANNVRALNLATQGVAFDNTETNKVYNVLGDLYWNDASGTPVKITDGGSIDISNIAVSTWTSVNIASDTSIPANATYTTLMVNTSFAWTITLPAASNMSPGRIFLIVDHTGNAATAPINLVPTGTDTIDGAASVSLNQPYGQWMAVTNGTDSWHLLYSQPSVLPAGATYTIGGTLAFAAGTGHSTTGDPRFTNDITVFGASDLHGNVTAYAEFDVRGTSQFEDNVTMDNDLLVGGSVDIQGNLHVTGSGLNIVEGNFTVIGDGEVDGDLIVVGGATIGNGLLVQAGTTDVLNILSTGISCTGHVGFSSDLSVTGNTYISGVLDPGTMVQPQTIALDSTLTRVVYQQMPLSASTETGWWLNRDATEGGSLVHTNTAAAGETFAPLFDLCDGATLTTLIVNASSAASLGLTLYRRPAAGGLTSLATVSGSATLTCGVVIDKSTYTYLMGISALTTAGFTIRSIKATHSVTTNQFQ